MTAFDALRDWPNHVRRFRLAWCIIRAVGRLIDSVDRDAQYARGRSTWIKTPWAKVYLRVNRRCLSFGAAGSWCIDFASVEVAERYRGRGFCKTMLTAIENQARGRGLDAVFAENVNNDDLLAHFTRRGYEPALFEPRSLFLRTRQ